MTRQMEGFPNLLDLIYISIWETAHRKHLERGGLFKNKTWMVIAQKLRLSHLKKTAHD